MPLIQRKTRLSNRKNALPKQSSTLEEFDVGWFRYIEWDSNGTGKVLHIVTPNKSKVTDWNQLKRYLKKKRLPIRDLEYYFPSDLVYNSNKQPLFKFKAKVSQRSSSKCFQNMKSNGNETHTETKKVKSLNGELLLNGSHEVNSIERNNRESVSPNVKTAIESRVTRNGKRKHIEENIKEKNVKKKSCIAEYRYQDKLGREKLPLPITNIYTTNTTVTENTNKSKPRRKSRYSNIEIKSSASDSKQSNHDNNAIKRITSNRNIHKSRAEKTSEDNSSRESNLSNFVLGRQKNSCGDKNAENYSPKDLLNVDPANHDNDTNDKKENAETKQDLDIKYDKDNQNTKNSLTISRGNDKSQITGFRNADSQPKKDNYVEKSTDVMKVEYNFLSEDTFQNLPDSKSIKMLPLPEMVEKNLNSTMMSVIEEDQSQIKSTLNQHEIKSSKINNTSNSFVKIKRKPGPKPRKLQLQEQGNNLCDLLGSNSSPVKIYKKRGPKPKIKPFPNLDMFSNMDAGSLVPKKRGPKPKVKPMRKLAKRLLKEVWKSKIDKRNERRKLKLLEKEKQLKMNLTFDGFDQTIREENVDDIMLRVKSKIYKEYFLKDLTTEEYESTKNVENITVDKEDSFLQGNEDSCMSFSDNMICSTPIKSEKSKSIKMKDMPQSSNKNINGQLKSDQVIPPLFSISHSCYSKLNHEYFDKIQELLSEKSERPYLKVVSESNSSTCCITQENDEILSVMPKYSNISRNTPPQIIRSHSKHTHVQEEENCCSCTALCLDLTCECISLGLPCLTCTSSDCENTWAAYEDLLMDFNLTLNIPGSNSSYDDTSQVMSGQYSKVVLYNNKKKPLRAYNQLWHVDPQELKDTQSLMRLEPFKVFSSKNKYNPPIYQPVEVCCYSCKSQLSNNDPGSFVIICNCFQVLCEDCHKSRCHVCLMRLGGLLYRCEECAFYYHFECIDLEHMADCHPSDEQKLSALMLLENSWISSSFQENGAYSYMNSNFETSVEILDYTSLLLSCQLADNYVDYLLNCNENNLDGNCETTNIYSKFHDEQTEEVNCPLDILKNSTNSYDDKVERENLYCVSDFIISTPENNNAIYKEESQLDNLMYKLEFPTLENSSFEENTIYEKSYSFQNNSISIENWQYEIQKELSQMLKPPPDESTKKVTVQDLLSAKQLEVNRHTLVLLYHLKNTQQQRRQRNTNFSSDPKSSSQYHAQMLNYVMDSWSRFDQYSYNEFEDVSIDDKNNVTFEQFQGNSKKDIRLTKKKVIKKRLDCSTQSNHRRETKTDKLSYNKTRVGVPLKEKFRYNGESCSESDLIKTLKLKKSYVPLNRL